MNQGRQTKYTKAHLGNVPNYPNNVTSLLLNFVKIQNIH